MMYNVLYTKIRGWGEGSGDGVLSVGYDLLVHTILGLVMAGLLVTQFNDFG
jgi:hypothetical protein